MNISLSEVIDSSENLGRIICAGSTRSSYRKSFDEDPQNPGKYFVKTGVFIDKRTPMQFSVNRISTLTEQQVHKLGLDHQEKTGRPSYNGYAKIKAELCYGLNCVIEKDDVNGTNPYHANIIYPEVNEKQDYQEIAAQLALHAEFVKYNNNPN